MRLPSSPPSPVVEMDLPRVHIQGDDFAVDEEIAKIKAVSNRIGGIVAFLGTARDFSKGREILKIEFEHYPQMAEKVLAEIRQKALKEFNIIEVAIIHRVGTIRIGENIVLIIVAAEHRQDAFHACAWCIDALKKTAPIWKKETTPQGTVWVEEHP